MEVPCSGVPLGVFGCLWHVFEMAVGSVRSTPWSEIVKNLPRDGRVGESLMSQSVHTLLQNNMTR